MEYNNNNRLLRTTSPLENAQDLEPLMKRIGDCPFVLLGEASHGTSEFYSWRAEITKRLITEKDFSFVAVEGDWPDCFRVNNFVKGRNNSLSSAYEVLHAFSRWPTWMWANKEIVELIEWLKLYNQKQGGYRSVGFYGLDVYSLWESLDTVIQFLRKNYPESMKSAIEAYRCFEPYGGDVEEYARATAFIPESCEDEVTQILVELREKARKDGHALKDGGKEAYLNAEQNAVVARDAELYYRTMMNGGAASWNVRDHHMMDTLTRLMKFHGKGAKSIVWAHNTHIGDARATDMKSAGMVNLGQLAREQAGSDNIVLAGFSTYSGNVVAAKGWGEPMEKMLVPPAIGGSWDNFLHELTGGKDTLILFDGAAKDPENFVEIRGQRAIGVVYNPYYERHGNYVETILSKRYDALMFIDQSHAVSPLHLPISPDEELPETFPSGV